MSRDYSFGLQSKDYATRQNKYPHARKFAEPDVDCPSCGKSNADILSIICNEVSMGCNECGFRWINMRSTG